MKSLLVIDSVGNRQEYNVDEIPRIGEMVALEHAAPSDSVTHHYFRVKDVQYNLQGAPGRQAIILLGEEIDEDWPH